MRYHNITKDDMRNGDGLRAVLWVSGCSHGCKQCHNPVTWDEEDGLIFDENALEEIFSEMGKSHVSGLTLSGGDPLFYNNRNDILELVKAVKHHFPDKTIWLYTGFNWNEIKSLEILNYVDVIVDGKFIVEQKNTQLHWRGSNNQRVIDVKKSRETEHIKLYCE